MWCDWTDHICQGPAGQVGHWTDGSDSFAVDHGGLRSSQVTGAGGFRLGIGLSFCICIIRQGQWRILLLQLRRTGTGWDVLSCVAAASSGVKLPVVFLSLLDSLGFCSCFSWQNDIKVRCWNRVPWTIIKSLGICTLLIHPYPSLHAHTATLTLRPTAVQLAPRRFRLFHGRLWPWISCREPEFWRFYLPQLNGDS